MPQVTKTLSMEMNNIREQPDCGTPNNNHTAITSTTTTIITLNVSGRRFMTSSTTLARVPGTLLSQLSPSDVSYSSSREEYFFDRNPAIFDYILDSFRTGCLHIPPNMCPFFVQQELEFWGIKDSAISSCCWPEYATLLYEKAKVEALTKSLQHPYPQPMSPDEMRAEMGCYGKWRQWRRKAWTFFEDPTSSKLAQAWGVFYLTAVLVSVALQCMLSHPFFRIPLEVHKVNISAETNPKIIMYAATDPYPGLEVLDDCCLGVFLLELVARLVVCPDYGAFMTSIYNIIDIACVIPMLVSVIVANLFPNFLEDDSLFAFVFFLAFLGIFRIFRLIKFARNFMGMRVMLLALRASMREILLLGMLISIATLVFSTLVYYAEFYTEDEFLNIPIGFWWAIVTMTTVGYGDKHPKTGWGYVVGSLCALSGMLCTGLPIPIIANNFNLFYARTRGHRAIEDDAKHAIPGDKCVHSKGCFTVRVSNHCNSSRPNDNEPSQEAKTCADQS